MIHITLRHWPYIEWRQESVTSKTLGWIALVVCIIAAGTYTSFGKVLSGTLSPLTLFFLSESLTGFFVIFSFGLMPVVRSIGRLRQRHLFWMLVVGLLSSTAAPLLQFGGLRLSTAVNASFFGSMEPFFMLVLAILVLNETMRREHFLSAIIMMLGMMTIVLRGFTEGYSLQSGDMLLVASSFAFAGGSIVFRKFLHAVEPHIVLFVRSSVAVVCFFLISPFTNHPLITELQHLPLSILPVLLGFTLISRFLNIFSFYQALDRLPVSVVSLLLNLSVITAIILAHVLLGEPLYAFHFIGGGLILAGSALLELRGLYPSKEHLEQHHRTRGPRA